MLKPAALFFLIGLLLVKTSRSQSSELLVQGETGKLYLLHTVAPKENWYSVGRLFNLSPKDLASFNNLTLDKPLSIDQSLQIPLTAVNFSQSGQKAAAGETLVPVYHIVQEKEWMYRVSVNHNKVPVENLEKWNNINKDLVKAGMHLIVGFLKVKTALSALAAGVPGAAVASNPVKTKPETTPVGTPGNAGGSMSGSTVKNKPVGVTTDSPAVNKPVSKMIDNKPAGTTGTGTSGTGTTGTGSGITPPGTGTTPGTGSGVTGTGVPTPAAAHFNGGYFKADYNDESLSATGIAGIFKSTSGWQDGKYYALMNNVAVGTIIKVTVPPTNKTIYAKVLGQLPDMKESSGMTVRISNAAASELGQVEGKFNVEVKY